VADEIKLLLWHAEISGEPRTIEAGRVVSDGAGGWRVVEELNGCSLAPVFDAALMAELAGKIEVVDG